MRLNLFKKRLSKNQNNMKTNNEHIENEFPTLEKLKGQNGFNTPEGYFDSLQNSIMSQVNETKKTTVISFYKVLGYAASVAVIAAISSLFFFGGNDQNSLDEFGQLTVNEYFEDITEIDLELDESLEFDEMAMNYNGL